MFRNSSIKSRVFHSNETNDALYSNMKFKDMFEWDEFYYSPHTKQILNTPIFKIGKDHPQVTEFEVNIERIKKEDYLTDV